MKSYTGIIDLNIEFRVELKSSGKSGGGIELNAPYSGECHPN